MRLLSTAAVALAAGLLAPAAALAQDPSYSEPSNPGKVTPRPSGKGERHSVCKRGCDFRRTRRR